MIHFLKIGTGILMISLISCLDKGWLLLVIGSMMHLQRLFFYPLHSSHGFDA
ncbi:MULTISPECIES: hypothetical protein [Acidaminococcus]|uniref:hypothetical protein n=1 Tax=Acidaminococcus TaxID=904 RepID=UPI0003A3E4ED|nr:MULTISPECIES: hypothetical protein [Acidaminococcus]MCB5829435.1 hypothetical protein [Acidaminococcus intestini]